MEENVPRVEVHRADKGGIKYLGCKRGVTLGNPIGQMLGNLALSLVDYAMAHIEHAKGYHRHCVLYLKPIAFLPLCP